jgi:hypothetical protein
MAIKMLYTSRNFNKAIPCDHQKKLLTHEIAIKMLQTQQHDNLSDSMWQLKNKN